MSILPTGSVGSDQSSGGRFIASSLEAINRPPRALPSTPALHRCERRKQSRWGSSNSRLTIVKTPRINWRHPFQQEDNWTHLSFYCDEIRTAFDIIGQDSQVLSTHS
ncbi:hypothetical protein UY3_09855 [Chelonia mydas]|uniref:Uncharacterized protein n=1 Tax=Chelonia mydas TaxID=8469 RepID=M7B7A6_CHEMY|nr:hypothetical protein UY3_09855 [Chelonia mydas]